jgi:hypothetical protein
MRLIYWVCAQGIHVLGWIQDWAYERRQHEEPPKLPPCGVDFVSAQLAPIDKYRPELVLDRIV